MFISQRNNDSASAYSNLLRSKLIVISLFTGLEAKVSLAASTITQEEKSKQEIKLARNRIHGEHWKSYWCSIPSTAVFSAIFLLLMGWAQEEVINALVSFIFSLILFRRATRVGVLFEIVSFGLTNIQKYKWKRGTSMLLSSEELGAICLDIL